MTGCIIGQLGRELSRRLPERGYTILLVCFCELAIELAAGVYVAAAQYSRSN